MKLRFLHIGLMACLLVGLCHADQSKSKARRAVQPIAAAPQIVAPTVPLRPEQMPAVPPQVAFSQGQLTISAENSTLGDILRAVRNQTGASVDVPSNATERVVGNFGPGPARDVLTSLLNGTHFNYVLMGSASNPNALDRVVLITKSSDGSAPEQTVAEQGPAPVPASQAGENFEQIGDEQADQPPEQTDLFAEDPNAQATEDQTANPFAQPANVKTPDQMLQDLQRQQQVQQQMQQIQQQQQQMGIPSNLQPLRGIPPGGRVLPPPQPQ